MSLIQPTDPIYQAHLPIVLPMLAQDYGDKDELLPMFEALQVAFEEYEQQLCPDREMVAIFERLKKCYKRHTETTLARVYPAAFERHWRRIHRCLCQLPNAGGTRLSPHAPLLDILFLDTAMDWFYLTGRRAVPQDITRH